MCLSLDLFLCKLHRGKPGGDVACGMAMPSRSCVLEKVFLPLSHDSLHIRVLCSVGDLVQSTRSGSRCGLYDTLVPRMGNKGDDIDLS